MTAYIIRRIIQSFCVLLISTFMIFCVVRLLPGDPILLYLSQDEYETNLSQEEIDALRHEYGLDRSIPVQYLDWGWKVLHGDLGVSIFYGTTVWFELRQAVPISLYLGLIGWVISHILGVPAGIVCAVRRGKWIDTVLTVFGNIGITAPVFWLGVLLIYVFGLWLGWLPIQGWTSPFDDLWMNLRQILMPVVCLGLPIIAGDIRMVRSAMLEVTRQDYIRTAWSKGLSERTIIFKHALRNGIIPIVTLMGMSVPQVFGGQVLIETVFNIPGMGRLAVEALFSQDYAIIQGIALMMTSIIITCNFLVDISYGWIDPRVKYS